MELTLLANVAVAAVAGWAMLLRQLGRGAGGSTLAEAALTAAAAGVLGGRLVTMLGNGVAPWRHPADIVLVRSGVSTVGAALVAGAVFLILARRSPAAMADGIAAAALAALAGWHGGCLTRSACLGTPSQLPWAVAQGGSAVTRHPVEIYAALLLAVAAIGVAVWQRRFRPVGVAAALAVAVAAGVRLATEPMRPSLFGGPTWFYAGALACGALTAAWLSLRARRSPLSPR